MLKKGLVFPIIIVVAIFITLSASIILLQNKKLVGFVILGNTCPQSINSPGFYEMNENIGPCHNTNGINIGAGDVILDCKGHSITGNAEEWTTGINITSNSYTNITINNCSIINFKLGINKRGSQITIANTSITGNDEQNCGTALPTGCVCGFYTDGGGNGGCLGGGCVENIVNSTPTEWVDVGCVNNDMNQSRNFTEYDANDCGTFENITHFEYRLLEANLENITSDWVDVGCVNYDMNQTRNVTQYDSNNLGCYENETFIEYRLLEANITSTDWTEWQDNVCQNSQMNQTRSREWYDSNNLGCYENYTEYDSRLVGPEWQYTSWSEWQNLTCSGSNMNQSRSRTKYDSYSCAENITEYDYQLVGPDYVNVSFGEWTDFSCVNSTTKNQSRIISQQDSYGCSDDRNITEYRNVGCDSGYSCSNGTCVASSSGG